jgi:hypothetical protein
MTARDWADVAADSIVCSSDPQSVTRLYVAKALRAAESRGYQRAQDEFKRITDAVWPMVEKDGKEQA